MSASFDMATFEPAVTALARALRARGWRLATAESCTGGLVAAACTAVAGSSEWFERGVVSYSNAAKVELLGVEPQTLQTHGAVSAEVARELACGALERSGADIAASVTGIAGPGGAVPGKPVGTVWIAVALRGGDVRTRLLQLSGDRASIRAQSVAELLAMLVTAAED